MSETDISVIIACYNEGPILASSVNKIVKVLNSLKKSWEIIFVEDKSTDETRKNVERISSVIKNSKVIWHQQNQGRGKTVSDGMKAARGTICGYLDVDLEISSSYIPIFISEIGKGFDMVIGKRFYEGSGSIIRLLASKIYALIVKSFLKIPIADTEAGYKFFRRSKILPVLAEVFDKQWFWDTEICARSYWAGLKISQVPVLFVRRDDKKSTVRLVPDTFNYLTKIIRFRSEVQKP